MPHYSFIEIGTSDFETICQTCRDDEVGISVEPVKEYLDALPSKKNVTKLNVAISDTDGFISIFHVSPNVLKSITSRHGSEDVIVYQNPTQQRCVKYCQKV